MEAQEMDIWKDTIQKEVDGLKVEQSNIKSDIRRLQDKQLLHDQEIKGIRDTLKEIKEDTKWLRRSITNAIIGAVIAGAVGIFWAAFNLN